MFQTGQVQLIMTLTPLVNLWKWILQNLLVFMAPLFEVQTDDWKCWCAVIWDPVHADWCCTTGKETSTMAVKKVVESKADKKSDYDEKLCSLLEGYSGVLVVGADPSVPEHQEGVTWRVGGDYV